MITLAIGGRARSGKNLFVSLLKEVLAERGITSCSVAFATCLKLELDATLRAKHGISAFTQETSEKVIIRDDLVFHGRRMREETGGQYWITQIANQIPTLSAYYDVLIVEDCRYANEATWVHGLGGKVIYVGRLDNNGALIAPANDEEAANDPHVHEAADHRIFWPTVNLTTNTLDHLRGYALSAWQSLGLRPE